MKVFFGMVYDMQEAKIVHSHISQSPDDVFNVNIWEEPTVDGLAPQSICVGEFRKWHHLVQALDPKRFDCISKFKEIPDINLLFFMDEFKDTSIL